MNHPWVWGAKLYLNKFSLITSVDGKGGVQWRMLLTAGLLSCPAASSLLHSISVPGKCCAGLTTWTVITFGSFIVVLRVKELKSSPSWQPPCICSHKGTLCYSNFLKHCLSCGCSVVISSCPIIFSLSREIPLCFSCLTVLQPVFLAHIAKFWGKRQ